MLFQNKISIYCDTFQHYFAFFGVSLRPIPSLLGFKILSPNVLIPDPGASSPAGWPQPPGSPDVCDRV